MSVQKFEIQKYIINDKNISEILIILLKALKKDDNFGVETFVGYNKYWLRMRK